MSLLNNKSEFNLEGAVVLIDSSLYAPSVHCSYYAVFQKIKYLFVNYSNITYDQLSHNIQNDKRNTHRYLIDEFCNLYLKKTENTFEYRKLHNEIKDLKTFREESDYEDLEINYSISTKALEKSREILKKVNKEFK